MTELKVKPAGTNLWWGYQHVNETYQVKRYFGPMDIEEAMQSNFVAEIAGPIPCTDRQDAINQIVDIIRSRLGLI